MFSSNCAVCRSKKSRFIKEQEVSRLLSTLGIRIPFKFSQIPLVVLFLFHRCQQVNTKYTMNEIVNNILLAGDKFMYQMHLRQPGCT